MNVNQSRGGAIKPVTADLNRQYGSIIADLAASPTLAVKDRELATIAALAAMGSKVAKQLGGHVHAALDAGATRQEIVEGLATMSQASGTPTSVNGLAIADRVFKERDTDGRATETERVWDAGDAPGGTVQDRWERALKTIEKVYPSGPTDDTYSAVQALAPHFWRDVATVFYNDLFNHPGVDIKYRELFVMSAYVALNSTPLQLRWHTNGALNTGWTRQQVAEIITHLAPHIGIPNAMSAIAIAKQVFEDRDAKEITKAHESHRIDERLEATDPVFKRGLDTIDRLNPERLSQGEGWEAAQAIAPGLYRLAVRHLFGEILERSGLDDHARHIAIISALAAHGGVSDQLGFHIEAALNVGITQQELMEAITLASAIGGFPNALNAGAVARQEFACRTGTARNSYLAPGISP